MVMDEHEILFSYNNAADQIKQVKILAELNDVDVWEMATWLKEHGAEINLQKFQRYNPRRRGAVKAVREPEPTEAAAPAEAEAADQDEKRPTAAPEEQEDPLAAEPEEPKPTAAKYQAALREAEALRERNNELYKQICDLTRELEERKPDRKAAATTAAAEPDRTALTDAQKIHITKILLKTYYESGINDAVTYLDILDAIINEEEDE